MALNYFSINNFMFSFDLKSGYHHIEIHEKYQIYLGFSWQNYKNGITKYYMFTVLPFGLSTAPYIFTKMLKPIEKHWRYQGIKMAILSDDGWATEDQYQKAKIQAHKVRNDLLSAGFIPNSEKSVWSPTQLIEWLGILWNSKDGTVSIVQRRLDKIMCAINHIIEVGYVISARELTSFVGQIISTVVVIGNIARLLTRHCRWQLLVHLIGIRSTN